jgi:hypothetical protein
MPRASLLVVSFLCLLAVALAACASQASSGSVAPTTTGNSGAASGAAPGPASAPPVAVPTTMYASVKAEVAHDMRLSVAQITVQLQADSHADLMRLAKSSGLAQDQLQRLLISALQSASDQGVRGGAWTQRQADTDMSYWKRLSAPELIAEISDWFRTR